MKDNHQPLWVWSSWGFRSCRFPTLGAEVNTRVKSHTDHGFRSSCRKVCHHRQSFSGRHSLGRSCSINLPDKLTRNLNGFLNVLVVNVLQKVGRRNLVGSGFFELWCEHGLEHWWVHSPYQAMHMELLILHLKNQVTLFPRLRKPMFDLFSCSSPKLHEKGDIIEFGRSIFLHLFSFTSNLNAVIVLSFMYIMAYVICVFGGSVFKRWHPLWLKFQRMRKLLSIQTPLSLPQSSLECDRSPKLK